MTQDLCKCGHEKDLCKCGHEKDIHFKEGCFHPSNDNYKAYCKCIKFIPAPVDAKGLNRSAVLAKSRNSVCQSSQVPQEHSPIYTAREIAIGYQRSKDEDYTRKQISGDKQFLDVEKVKEMLFGLMDKIGEIPSYHYSSLPIQRDVADKTIFEVNSNIRSLIKGLEEAKR
jgi:hypothetical protein